MTITCFAYCILLPYPHVAFLVVIPVSAIHLYYNMVNHGTIRIFCIIIHVETLHTDFFSSPDNSWTQWSLQVTREHSPYESYVYMGA